MATYYAQRASAGLIITEGILSLVHDLNRRSRWLRGDPRSCSATPPTCIASETPLATLASGAPVPVRVSTMR
ncbi:hypothetical protein [Pengzhenrongella sp.]|jgi:hypothetical protein|uniref:hypothetical protein n=1 Tax=Pengzhenrongella sp. TaxID=2888820 RepID=UPI002F954F8B